MHALLALALASTLAAAPAIDRPVVDQAGVLSQAEQDDLARQLRDLQAQVGPQMAVLVVRTTAGVPIEQYALEAARAWGGGRAGADDGALLVLALDDRRSRLEVGRGLAERLSDAEASRILAEAAPALRQAAYASAISNVIAAVRERAARPPPPLGARPLRPYTAVWLLAFVLGGLAVAARKKWIPLRPRPMLGLPLVVGPLLVAAAFANSGWLLLPYLVAYATALLLPLVALGMKHRGARVLTVAWSLGPALWLAVLGVGHDGAPLDAPLAGVLVFSHAIAAVMGVMALAIGLAIVATLVLLLGRLTRSEAIQRAAHALLGLGLGFVGESGGGSGGSGGGYHHHHSSGWESSSSVDTSSSSSSSDSGSNSGGYSGGGGSFDGSGGSGSW